MNQLFSNSAIDHQDPCRRSFLAATTFCFTGHACGQSENEALITAKADTAIDHGLDFLAKRQNEDGSFGTTTNSRDVGVSSLVGLSFLAGGSTPNRGKFGRETSRCLDYVLDKCDRNGYIQLAGLNPNRPMYGHGFGTLFLAECFGMSKRPDHREKLGKAARLIINTQNDEGGWRYLPQRRDADLSVTVCQMMALRAAKDAGIHVSKTTIQRASEYVRRCQNLDGGFRYQRTDGPSTFARAAAAIVGLYSAGIYDGKEIQNGLKYLSEFNPANNPNGTEQYFYYGHYYAALAMWQVGNATWKNWYAGIRDELLSRQAPRDGSWPNAVWSPEYGTALATIILQIPNDLVPIFQR